jgi:hypothetical protein
VEAVVHKWEKNTKRASEIGSPAYSEVNTRMITSLLPSLRKELLATADNNFLNSLPAEFKAEGKRLRIASVPTVRMHHLRKTTTKKKPVAHQQVLKDAAVISASMLSPAPSLSPMKAELVESAALEAGVVGVTAAPTLSVPGQEKKAIDLKTGIDNEMREDKEAAMRDQQKETQRLKQLQSQKHVHMHLLRKTMTKKKPAHQKTEQQQLLKDAAAFSAGMLTPAPTLSPMKAEVEESAALEASVVDEVTTAPTLSTHGEEKEQIMMAASIASQQGKDKKADMREQQKESAELETSGVSQQQVAKSTVISAKGAAIFAAERGNSATKAAFGAPTKQHQHQLLKDAAAFSAGMLTRAPSLNPVLKAEETELETDVVAAVTTAPILSTHDEEKEQIMMADSIDGQQGKDKKADMREQQKESAELETSGVSQQQIAKQAAETRSSELGAKGADASHSLATKAAFGASTKKHQHQLLKDAAAFSAGMLTRAPSLNPVLKAEEVESAVLETDVVNVVTAAPTLSTHGEEKEQIMMADSIAGQQGKDKKADMREQQKVTQRLKQFQHQNQEQRQIQKLKQQENQDQREQAQKRKQWQKVGEQWEKKHKTHPTAKQHKKHEKNHHHMSVSVRTASKRQGVPLVKKHQHKHGDDDW